MDDDAEEEGDDDGDEEADGEDDGDVEADGDAEGEGDGEVEGEGEGEGEADGDAEADGEADGDGDADADGLAGTDGGTDAGTDGGTDGSTDGLRNDDADGPCSAAGVIWAEYPGRECRTGTEPPGTDGGELEISRACDVDSGSATAAPAWGCPRPAGDSGTAPVRRKTTTAQAATAPAAIHARPRRRDQRRRERRRPPGQGSPADTPAGEEAPASEGEEALASEGEDTPASDEAQSDPGTAPAPIAPSSPSSRLADGRSPGCLARQLPTRDRSSPGSSPRSAGLLTSRYISNALDPAPNGPCPVAA